MHDISTQNVLGVLFEPKGNGVFFFINDHSKDSQQR